MPYFPKAVIFLVVAATISFFLNREDDRGTFAKVDQEYISWLMANSKADIQEPSVTFLQIEDPDGSMFSDWPLQPIDYSILLGNLGKREPNVMAVTPTLEWGGSQERLYIDSLQNVLNRTDLDKVLFGAVLLENPAGEPIKQSTLSLFPQIENVEGDRSLIPEFTNIRTLPEPALTSFGPHLGFTRIDLGDAETEKVNDSITVPMLARHGDHIVPSFVLLAMMLDNKVPMGDVEVDLGNVIRLGDGLEIPIDRSGRLYVFTRIREKITKENVDILIATGDSNIAGQISDSQKVALEKRIVILGYDDPDSRTIPLRGEKISLGELFAMAMATIQAEQFIQKVQPTVRYAIWGALALLGLLLLRWKRGKGALAWVFLLVLYFVGNLILFQYSMQWTSLMVPMGILVVIGLGVTLLPETRENVAVGEENR